MVNVLEHLDDKADELLECLSSRHLEYHQEDSNKSNLGAQHLFPRYIQEDLPSSTRSSNGGEYITRSRFCSFLIIMCLERVRCHNLLEYP